MTARDRYDRMLSDDIRPVLAAAGFRKKRNSFAREVVGATHRVEFQASAFGSREAVRFTMNLGIDYDELLDGHQLRVRVGDLGKSGEDVWWDLDAGTDAAKLAATVIDAVTARVLPWFDERATFSAASNLLRQRPGAFDIGSLDRLGVLCERAGFADEAAASRAAAAKVRAS